MVQITQIPKLGLYDESISILKGQVETHNQKINLHQTNIDKIKLELAREEHAILQYEARIELLNIVVEELIALKAKG